VPRRREPAGQGMKRPEADLANFSPSVRLGAAVARRGANGRQKWPQPRSPAAARSLRGVRVMVIADIMTKNPVSAEASDTVRSVLATLLEMDVRHLPVLDEGQLVGIVSDRDLRNVQMPFFEDNSDEADDSALSTTRQRLLEQPISAIMSSDVLSVDPETDLADAVDLMIEHRVGAIPVVSPDTDDLVGIVSYIDVLKAARESI
jgi:CBS-domain-containing membrane protein